MSRIPYARQEISPEDIEAVTQVLTADYLTQGPQVPVFEQAIADYCTSRHAVAVTNATSALHLACMALEVGAGDIVWTSPITFVASANCALYCGAEVDFVDIDPATFNLSVEHLSDKLSLAKRNNQLPKVLICVHMAGLSCDMQAIHRLSQEYGFAIIEDAAHAIGGYYQDHPIGSCQYSDITVFSFHPVKIITTAEGGMAVTNSEHLYRKMTLLRSHGVTRDEELMTHDSDGPWYYQQLALGHNYRMTELQAALGLSQLKRLGQFVEQRHRLANIYRRQLTGLPLTFQTQTGSCHSAYHLLLVQLDLGQLTISRRELFEQLQAQGIGVNVHYIPVHTQPYFQTLGHRPGDYPQAENYYARTLTLPLYHHLSDEDLTRIIRVFSEMLIANLNRRPTLSTDSGQ